MTAKASEIFQRPLADLTDTPDEAGAADEVLQRIMLDYAARGFTAAVTIEDGEVRGIAVPERGIEPKEYLIGLLRQGFLEDALPSLEIFSRMVDDEDIEYNLGLCLSELGRVAESVAPLKRCLVIDPDYQDARTALGVSFSRLGQREAAEKTFREVLKREPSNPHANRNLGALLSRSGRAEEALPLFRQAVKSLPEDLGAKLGLADCLVEIGGENLSEGEALYRSLLDRYANHPVAEQIKAGLTRVAHGNLRARVPGGVRMDAVMYMNGAMRQFAEMDRRAIGHIVLEIARLGGVGSQDQRARGPLHPRQPRWGFLRPRTAVPDARGVPAAAASWRLWLGAGSGIRAGPRNVWRHQGRLMPMLVGRRPCTEAEAIRRGFGGSESARRREVLAETLQTFLTASPPDQSHRLACKNHAHWASHDQTGRVPTGSSKRFTDMAFSIRRAPDHQKPG